MTATDRKSRPWAADLPRLRVGVIALTLATLLSSCGPLTEARRSMRRGEPVQAVQLYQQAAAEDPDDTSIAEELQRARHQAGEVLAQQARAALEAGELAEAVRFAAQAATHDPQYRSLEQQARHARADELLARAESALDDGAFDRARQLAGVAADVAHDRADPPALLAEIDAAQAEQLRAGLPALLDAGQFDTAARFAQRAAALQPGDPTYAALRTDVDRRRREAAFDALAVDARTLISEGKLSSFWPVHAEMAALDVRRNELADIQQQFEAREQRFLDALNAAQAAHDAGTYQAAIRQYELAQSIATDREDLDQQRAAAANLLRARQLKQEGRAALEQSQFHDAVDALRASVQLHAVAETEALLRDAEQRYYRQQYRDALDNGDRAMAIDNLAKLLRLAPDDELAQLLANLKSELVDAALNEASTLHADGDTETAMHVLRRAMQRVNDRRLDAMHAELKAERLLQRAVAADQSGAFVEARDLYLAALAVGGDRAALEARIDDARVLADMQADLEAAEQYADELGAALNSTRLTLQSRERDIRALENQIRDCEAELDRLAHALRQTEYDLGHERSRNSALESRIYALEHEIHRLKDRLRHRRDHPHRDHD